MVKIIMHGCNGHMGQVISGLVEKDPDAEIVAGIDVADQGKNSYPVYTNMEECQVEADALIDFSSAKAIIACLSNTLINSGKSIESISELLIPLIISGFVMCGKSSFKSSFAGLILLIFSSILNFRPRMSQDVVCAF